MSIIKAAPLAAAAALVLLAVSSQAEAATRHQSGYGTYAQQPAGETFNSVYRDPTTREGLDEGTW